MIIIETDHGPVQRHGLGPINIVLAHGSGIGMNHSFMQAVAQEFDAVNFSVYLFEFSYMQQVQATGRKRPPPAVAKLEVEFVAQLQQLNLAGPVFLGGKSLGSRVASMVIEQTNALGWFALGYPFHPQKKPEKLRVSHLLSSHQPALIVQGTRDGLGSYNEVQEYQLPSNIDVHWLDEMDHSFSPFKKSPYTQQQAIEKSTKLIELWAIETLKCGPN